MSTETDPVLVVGAGPAGLALALTLLKNGIPVRVINKAPSFHEEQRGIGIQPRTLEVFHFLGILPEVLAEGQRLQPIRFYKLPGGTEVLATIHLSPIEEDTPQKPFNNGFQLSQYRTEAILRSHLRKYGCSVELSTELVAFTQFADRVEATIKRHEHGKETVETQSYHWLIGADGGRSAVRKQCGLSFEGMATEERYIIGELYSESLDTEVWHSWINKEVDPPTSILIRVTESGRCFFMMSGNTDSDKLLSSHAALKDAIRKLTDRSDLQFGDVVHLSAYRPSVRMVNKFGEGRVFVAGDAAHVHTPRGGQGLNSSVQDAFNIGWKLALVEKGLASPALLDTYTEERLPVIDWMIHKTGNLSRLDAGKARDGEALKAALQRGSHLKQLCINYRWSSIVLDEFHPYRAGNDAMDPYGLDTGDTLRAGERAPNATGLQVLRRGGGDTDPRATSLFDLFGPTHHTVLIFGVDATHVTAVVEGVRAYPQGTVVSVLIHPGAASAVQVDGVDVTLQDRDGIAYDGYRVAEGQSSLVVVRPDGFVGAVVSGVEGCMDYFGRIFTGVAKATY